MKQVVAVVGPTASGKTSLAIELAEALRTEVVSADSMQFYRGMEIGTGAPTAAQLARVRHHFIGSLDPSEEISAGRFELAAREVVAGLNAAGKPVVVVGGSGLYIRALIDGLFSAPGKALEVRERLEAEARERGIDRLYDRLKQVDPAYAAMISGSDLRRIVRALEVAELTGTPLSQLHDAHQASAEGLDALQVGLAFDRAALYARVDARVDDMVERGLVQEVRRLLDTGHGGDIVRLKSLGYREIAAHIRGERTLVEATDEMKMNTRRYAKRQLTWFRADDRIVWLDADEYATAALRRERVLELLANEDA